MDKVRGELYRRIGLPGTEEIRNGKRWYRTLDTFNSSA